MKVDWRTTFEVLTCVAFACVAIPFFVGYTYKTNDDVVFRLIAERHLASDLSQYLVFVNIIIGRILKSLYDFMPGWPWFDLLTQVVVAASAGALFWVARKIPELIARESLTAALAVGVVLAAASPHFTQTATLAAAAGLALIGRISLVPREPLRILSIVAGTALFVVGGFYRSSAAQLVTVLSVPTLSLAFLTSRSRQRLAVACAALLAAVGLHLIAQGYDDDAYRNHPEWSTFRLHNEARNQVVDFGTFTRSVCPLKMDSLIESAGWSQSDFKMLRSFSFSNPKVFSAERTQTLAKALSVCNARTSKHLWIYLNWRFQRLPYLMFPMLLVLALGVCINANRKMLLATGIYAVFAISVWMTVEFLYKPLPATAAFAFGISAWCFVHVAVIRFPSQALVAPARFGYVLPAVLVAAIGVAVSVSEAAHRLPLPASERAVVRALAEFDQVVPIGAVAKFEKLIHPFSPIESSVKVLRPGGWLDQTPFQQRDPVLRDGGDLIWHACMSPRKAMLMSAKQLAMVQAYLVEHFSEDVTFEEVIASDKRNVLLVRCRVARASRGALR